ncbi:MAG: molybdenum cofactor guanylyltransferase [Opitutaceae bacterium]
MPARPQPSVPFSAVLLAAGRSARMGREKALLRLRDRPLWRRQRDVLRAAGAGELLLSARPDQRWARRAAGFAAGVHDPVPDGGPLAGIVAALEAAAHEHVAVLAIDLPQLPARWLAELAAAAGENRGVVGRRGDRFEPLAAGYTRRMLPPCRAALARGELALQPLLSAAVAAGLLRVRRITADELAWFVNWNTPAARRKLLSSRRE